MMDDFYFSPTWIANLNFRFLLRSLFFITCFEGWRWSYQSTQLLSGFARQISGKSTQLKWGIICFVIGQIHSCFSVWNQHLAKFIAGGVQMFGDLEHLQKQSMWNSCWELAFLSKTVGLTINIQMNLIGHCAIVSKNSPSCFPNGWTSYFKYHCANQGGF